MISAEFKRSVEAELKRLMLEREKLTTEIDERIKQLQGFLAKGTGRQTFVNFALASSTKTPMTTPPSFTSAVESVLSECPNGMRPMEVTKCLVAMGVKTKGNTSIGNRVAGE